MTSSQQQPRQTQDNILVLHISRRSKNRSSPDTTSRPSGNGTNLPVAPNRVHATNPSHDKSSPNKRLNPNAITFVPTTIYTAPAPDHPGWVDVRNPSPSLSRGSTLNPIEEEPDLIGEDVIDESDVDDLPPLPLRDEMTGGFITNDDAPHVYDLDQLLSCQSHCACAPAPEVFAESALPLEPFHSIVEGILRALNDPISIPPRRPRRPIRKPCPRRPYPRPPRRPPRHTPLSQLRPKTIVPPTELEQLMRKTMGILNRISPDKFDRLITRLLELIKAKVTCAEHLEAVLKAVVNTAVLQPAFVERYVEVLCVLSAQEEVVDSWEWAHAQHVNSRKIIKSIIFDICRRLHESYWYQCQPDQQPEFLWHFGQESWGIAIDDDVLGIIGSFSPVSEEEVAKAKDKFFGIEIVMAEMCNQKLMSKGLLCQNVINPLARLQQKKDTSQNDDGFGWRGWDCSAVELEALCKLLTVCGATLDRSAAARWVDTYLDIIWDRANNFGGRMKFMAMDLCDLRDANWNDRHAEPDVEERISLARKPEHRRPREESMDYHR